MGDAEWMLCWKVKVSDSMNCDKCGGTMATVGADLRTGVMTARCNGCGRTGTSTATAAQAVDASSWGICQMSVELPRPLSEEQRAVNKALGISDEEFEKFH